MYAFQYDTHMCVVSTLVVALRARQYYVLFCSYTELTHV